MLRAIKPSRYATVADVGRACHVFAEGSDKDKKKNIGTQGVQDLFFCEL